MGTANSLVGEAAMSRIPWRSVGTGSSGRTAGSLTDRM